MLIILDQTKLILYAEDHSFKCDINIHTKINAGKYILGVNYSFKHRRTLPFFHASKITYIWIGEPDETTITVGHRTSEGKMIQKMATHMMLQDNITAKIKSGENVWLQVK